MAESLLPGARVCDVAQKYGLIAHHVSQWRGLARKGKLVLPGDDGPAFVPLMVEPVAVPRPVVATSEAGVVRMRSAGRCWMWRQTAARSVLRHWRLRHWRLR